MVVVRWVGLGIDLDSASLGVGGHLHIEKNTGCCLHVLHISSQWCDVSVSVYCLEIIIIILLQHYTITTYYLCRYTT